MLKRSRGAMILSSSGVRSTVSQITIGKAGQILNISLAHLSLGPRSRKFRRRGDANTTYRHLWHTCASAYHASYECLSSSPSPRTYHGSTYSSLSRHKSKISRQTSSESISIATFRRGGPILPNSLIAPRVSGQLSHTLAVFNPQISCNDFRYIPALGGHQKMLGMNDWW